MDTTSRNTLIGQQLQFVGFCFFDHPTKKNHFAQLSVFRFVFHPKKFAICTSEGAGNGHLEMAKNNLGQIRMGEEISPFAARQMEGSYEDVKKVLEEADKLKWHWL